MKKVFGTCWECKTRGHVIKDDYYKGLCELCALKNMLKEDYGEEPYN